MEITLFNKELKHGIHKCPADKRYVVVHVFSGQMAIWCAYYDDLATIADGLANGIVDPQGADEVKAIYDMKDKMLLYYDCVGMVDTIHSAWETLTKQTPK